MDTSTNARQTTRNPEIDEAVRIHGHRDGHYGLDRFVTDGEHQAAYDEGYDAGASNA